MYLVIDNQSIGAQCYYMEQLKNSAIYVPVHVQAAPVITMEVHNRLQYYCKLLTVHVDVWQLFPVMCPSFVPFCINIPFSGS